MALYINGNKVANSLVIDGIIDKSYQETIWTSGDMNSPAVVNTDYTFSKTLDNFDLIKIVLTSTQDGAGSGICGSDLWSVKSIKDAIAHSLYVTPSPFYKGKYDAHERFCQISFSNSGFTVLSNGYGQSVYAIIGIKCNTVDKIFDTGSVTSLVALNSQQTLLKSLDNYDLIQVVISDPNDSANGLVATDYINVAEALTTGMISLFCWFKFRQFTVDFNNDTFTVTSSSAWAEASGYSPSIYQIYGIKLSGIIDKGSVITPTFSSTVLVSNPNADSSFTFSEDYHNYDFVRFKLFNSSSGAETYILTTPSTIDAILDIAPYINLNEYCNNQYCAYSQSNLTWTKDHARNCDIVEVVGLNCTNATVTETEIYKASVRTSAAIDITTQLDLMGFDFILFAANSGNSDEVQPCYNVFIPSQGVRNVLGQPIGFAFNYYGSASSGVLIKVNNNYISENMYAYIVGIKFT